MTPPRSGGPALEEKPPAFFAALIAAAGSSARMGGIKKEYAPLVFAETGEQTTVLGCTALSFAAAGIPLMMISVPDNRETGEAAARRALPARLLRASSPLTILFTNGAQSRRESVFNALRALKEKRPGYVLIHDGARPWADAALIRRVMAAARESRAALPALPLSETPKELDGAGFIKNHLRRAALALAQTPQGFEFEGILRAHENAEQKNRSLAPDARIEYTDDAEIWGAFEGPVKTVEGSRANRKITFPEDL